MVVLYPLLSNHEKELTAIFIEMARNVDRAVQVPAELVIAKSLSREVSAIALPGVGIERAVAEVPKDGAGEAAGAALGDQANQTARGAAVLCRIAGSQNLHLRGG